jgi:hypothetical protein
LGIGDGAFDAEGGEAGADGADEDARGAVPPRTKPAVRPVPRCLRTETLRRRGVVVVKVGGGGGVVDFGDDFAGAAIGGGETGRSCRGW